MRDEQPYGRDTRSHRQEPRHPLPGCTMGTSSRVRLGVREKPADESAVCEGVVSITSNLEREINLLVRRVDLNLRLQF